MQPKALQTTMQTSPLLVNKAQAAQMLSISIRLLEALAARGEIMLVRLNRRALVRVSDLTALARRGSPAVKPSESRNALEQIEESPMTVDEESVQLPT
jgi:hypothetical protein